MLYRKIWLSGAILAAAALPAGGGAAEKPRVLLETSAGNIVIELYPDKAPESARNFLAYVESRYYDGLIFHRVIPGFMIQGGGFKPGMEQRESTRSAIRNEADNGLRNLRGTVAMARTSDPHSATAQFFINLVDNAFLDHTAKTPRGWGYAVFGQVVEGLETVDKIAQADTDRAGPHGDVPVEDIVIRRASLASAEEAAPQP